MLLTSTYFCPEVDSAHAWKSVILGREGLRREGEPLEDKPSTLSVYENFARKVATWYRVFESLRLLCCLCCASWLPLYGSSISNKKNRQESDSLSYGLAMGVAALLFVVSLPGAVSTVSTGRIRELFYKAAPRSPVENLINCLYLREASEPKDMAFGVWAVLQKKEADRPLPTISYTNDLKHIYWTLTTELIQRTHSLQLLYLAPSKGMSDAPSWVPDWSARNEHQWRTIMSSMSQTDRYGRDLTPRAQRAHRFREKDTAAYFELDTTQTILTVRGLHVCDIGAMDPLDFQETKNDFHESERAVHLDNLRLMLKYASPWGNIWNYISADLKTSAIFPYSLLGRVGKFRTDPWYQERAEQISTWAHFCRHNARKSPSEALAFLRAETTLSNGSSTLATQVMISNLLAREGRSVFRAAGAPKSLLNFWYIKGICGRKAKVGDHVVRIVGVPQLLVLRRIPGAGNAARIISPAFFRDNSTLARSKKECVYQIH